MLYRHHLRNCHRLIVDRWTVDKNTTKQSERKSTQQLQRTESYTSMK